MWRVGFVGQTTACPWYARLLAPGFAHCWAARRLWRDGWLWVEWTPARLVLGLAGAAQVRRASAATSLLLVVEGAAAARPRRPILAVHSCASLVAHAVGVRVPFATPWRLARALRAGGARPIRAAEVPR